MINKLIIDTLAPLNIPVGFQKYSGTATTYITFFQYLEQGGQFADNTEKTTEHYIQVDIWSIGDYSTVSTNVITYMKAAGFRRISSVDLYESDVDVYHNAIRFLYED